MKIRAKSGTKLEQVLSNIRAILGNTDIDWERKTDPNNDIYFEGTFQNMKVEVRPKTVTIHLTRQNDIEGIITERKTINSPYKNAKSSLFTDLMHRFDKHSDFQFFTEVQQILEATLQPEGPIDGQKSEETDDQDTVKFL